MKIAVLVHSAVKNDARITKEAMSLRAAGHEVVIHGISPDRERHTGRLPGSDVPLWLEPRESTSARQRKRALFAVLLVPVLLMAGFAAQAVLRHGLKVGAHDLAVPALLLVAVLAITGLWRARHALARLAAHVDGFVMSRFAKNDDVCNALPGLTLGRGYQQIARALLRSLSRGPRPDAIHIHDHVALVLAARLKQLYAVPLVWDAHEIYQELAGGDAARARENAAIIAASQSFIDGFITINDSIAHFYAEHYPQLPKAVVVMNATLPEPVPAYDGRLHRAAELPLKQKILLFQGRFSAHRGLEHLVAAAASLKPEWTLVMMGWGGLEAPLRTVADSHRRDGEAATVFLPGVPQQELQQWSAGASLGVVPYENTSLNHLYCTPNKLWEYPGAGVPILCTDLPEMAAMVAEYGCGVLLPREFKAEDIATAVNALDDDALAQLRAHCAPFIAANNWSRWERNLLALYQQLTGVS